MPTQLQLEGPDLETLLARVRAEHGASARIVRAEKVRSGGVGGFFAKQHYEINVEVEDAPAAAPAASAAPAAPRPTSILDLADQVSATERSAAAVSTESTGFAAVLARLGATAGEAAPAPVVDAPRATAAPARRPAERPAALIPRQRAASSPATRRPRKPAAAAVSKAPVSKAPAVRTVRPQVGATGTPLVGTVVRAAVGPRPGTAIAVRTAAAAARPGTDVAVRAVAARPAARPAAARPGSTVAVRTRGTVAVTPARSTGALAAMSPRPARLRPDELDMQAQLVDLGLPEHLLPTADRDRLHAALVDVLEQLPKAPRTTNRAGSVIAIVGPLPLALEAARQIARELKLPVRSSVVLATGLRTLTDVPESNVLRDPEQARDRRPTWRRRKATTIVVIDAPLTAGGAAAAREYLDALEPTTTWCVVEATRKAHDVGAWTRSLGQVDALALTAVEETADPAAVLGLGIPVGRIGSRRATPATWASLLTGRIAA